VGGAQTGGKIKGGGWDGANVAEGDKVERSRHGNWGAKRTEHLRLGRQKRGDDVLAMGEQNEKNPRDPNREG